MLGKRRSKEPEFDFDAMRTGPTERPFGKISPGEIEKLGRQGNVRGLLDLLNEPEVASGEPREKLLKDIIMEVAVRSETRPQALLLAELLDDPVLRRSARLRGLLVTAISSPGMSPGDRVRGLPTSWEAVPVIVDLLKWDDDTEVRARGITALAYSGNPAATETLVRALRDRSLRRTAIRGLRTMKAREAVPALIDALNDPSFGVRRSVGFALADIRDERGAQPLTDAAKREKLFWRRSLMQRKARELRRAVGWETYE